MKQIDKDFRDITEADLVEKLVVPNKIIIETPDLFLNKSPYVVTA